MCIDGVLDGGGECGDLRDEGSKHRDESTDALALGVGLERAG